MPRWGLGIDMQRKAAAESSEVSRLVMAAPCHRTCIRRHRDSRPRLVGAGQVHTCA